MSVSSSYEFKTLGFWLHEQFLENTVSQDENFYYFQYLPAIQKYILWIQTNDKFMNSRIVYKILSICEKVAIEVYYNVSKLVKFSNFILKTDEYFSNG